MDERCHSDLCTLSGLLSMNSANFWRGQSIPTGTVEPMDLNDDVDDDDNSIKKCIYQLSWNTLCSSFHGSFCK